MKNEFSLNIAPEFETYAERNNRIIREAREQLVKSSIDRFPPVAFALIVSLCAATVFMAALLFA